MANTMKIDDLPEATEVKDGDYFVKQTVGGDTKITSAEVFAMYTYRKLCDIEEGELFTNGNYYIAAQENDAAAGEKISIDDMKKYYRRYLAYRASQQSKMYDDTSILYTDDTDIYGIKSVVNNGVEYGFKTHLKNSITYDNAEYADNITDTANLLLMFGAMPKPELDKTFFEVKTSKVSNSVYDFEMPLTKNCYFLVIAFFEYQYTDGVTFTWSPKEGEWDSYTVTGTDASAFFRVFRMTGGGTNRFDFSDVYSDDIKGKNGKFPIIYNAFAWLMQS